MEYFAGLDVSMEETHICVVDRDGVVVHEAKAVSTACGRSQRELAKAPNCRRIVFETGRMAPMLYHGLSRARTTRHMRREPAGLPGTEVAGDPQDRPQRCTRAGASCPHRLLQTRAREVAAGARHSVADYRSQEAGRPAGYTGEPDPRPRRGVRRPVASRAEPRLHPAGAQGERGHHRLCLPLCGA